MVPSEEPIKGTEQSQCPTCGEHVAWTVLLFPGRTVKMGECKRGHWIQKEEVIARG